MHPAVFVSVSWFSKGRLGWHTLGTSLGKRLFGLHAVTTDGRPPRPWQVIVRNLFKVVTLIVPPLAIFVLFNPTRQRLGDVAARTIVVKTVAPKSDDSHAPP